MASNHGGGDGIRIVVRIHAVRICDTKKRAQSADAFESMIVAEDKAINSRLTECVRSAMADELIAVQERGRVAAETGPRRHRNQ